MCNFYILFSPFLDKYYYGHTCDELKERIRKHNSNHKGFTGKTDDWELAYNEEYQIKAEANNRELQVKNWKNRKRVETLMISSRIYLQQIICKISIKNIPSFNNNK
jgi:putative endonuclease